MQNPTLNQGHIEAFDNRVSAREEVVNSFYFQNWTNISEKFKALIGLRYDIFNGTYYRDALNEDRSIETAGDKTEIPSSALTYRAGLVYQATSKASLFASYSTYFKPSRTFTAEQTVTDPVTNETTTIPAQLFDPEQGFQTEGGIKLEDDKYSVTASVFYLMKNNIVERNTNGEFNQIGEADSKGFELDLSYEPVEGLFIKAGYAFTEARVRDFDVDSLQATRAGNFLRYAPKHLANLWVNYQFQEGTVKGLGLGFGMNHVGENYTNTNNTYKLPAYTTVDAAISYSKNNIRVGLNVNNLADVLYFKDAIYGNQFFPGAGRNFNLSLGYKF